MYENKICFVFIFENERSGEGKDKKIIEKQEKCLVYLDQRLKEIELRQ